jgi:GntR family transcriptional regulator
MYTSMKAPVDKSNPIPLYLQLADWLEARLAQGELPVGARLPPETILAEEFELNRNTVRQAIGMLVQKGLVQKRRGVGTFVTRKDTLYPVHQLGRMTSFVDDFEFRAVDIENRVLAREKLPAPAEIAERLGIPPGDFVVRVERLRLADRTPFVLERGYYPHGPFGRMLDMDLRGSIYQLLVRDFNADLHHSVQTLRAVRPAREIALKLEISRSIPCMLLQSLAYSAQDVCLEVLQSFYRGDRYLFRVESGEYRLEMDSTGVG